MNVGWPEAVSFDPDSDGAAQILNETLGTQGDVPRSLLLISGEAARYSGWSARTAIALADALATRQPVILADLHFDQPELDGLVGSADPAGVADALLYGASLDHIALSSAGHRFELIPSGAPVPDQEAVMKHPAWGRLLDEVERRGATLLLYVPWRGKGLDALVERVGTAIMLGGNTDTRLAAGYLPPELRVGAVVAPASARTAAAAEPVAPAATAAPTSSVLVERKRSRGWLRLGLPIVLIAAAAVVVFTRTDFTPPAEAPPAASAPRAASGSPAGVVLPWAVAIEAHPEFATAVDRVTALQEVEPTEGFFLAPVLVDSVLYYRVMAGPVEDSADAALLMAKLVANGHKSHDSDFDIRNTPLAFELGIYDSAEDTRSRIEQLSAQGIPVYSLAVPYSGGGERYHLYCGAYSGPAEADVMRQVLADAGITATLVQRIGRSTP